MDLLNVCPVQILVTIKAVLCSSDVYTGNREGSILTQVTTTIVSIFVNYCEEFFQGLTFNGKHIFTGLMEDLIANTDILNAEQVPVDMMWGNLKIFSSDKINIDLIGVNSNEVTITLDMGYFEGQKL